MKPWIAGLLGAVVGMLAWAALWALYGRDMKSGRLGDAGLGFWVTFTREGDAMWLPYLLAAVICGGLAFLIVRSRKPA